MSQICQDNSLSWGDTFFLYLERDGQPLNIAGVSEVEGVLSLPKCIKFVESKLQLIPRYTQRVVAPPFNVGLPVWEADPAFNIRNHIREVTLKRGTDADLKKLAGELVGTRMNRDHPLWDFTLVRGLTGNRTGIVVRMHHCLADGIAGVGIMNVLLDPSPTPPKIKRAADPRKNPPNRDPGAMLLDKLLNSYISVLEGAFATHSEVLNIAQDLFAGAGKGTLTEMLQLVPELSTPAERLPFNKVCRGPQLVAWAELPMAEIKAVRQQCGATVNDVVLSVVTAAFRRYSELRGAHLKGKQLRVIVPVNIRNGSDVGALGNRITFLPVDLPLDMRDPRKLLGRVSERMTFLRSAGVAEFVGLAGGLISQIPLPVQALLAPIASQLPLSLCNTICTNVPGPQMPLYFVGHKMLRWYPYVPIGGEMGINVAVLTYNGTAYFGFSGDAHAAPDLLRLEKFVAVSFDELKKSAGVKPVVQTKQTPETRKPAAKKPETKKPETKRAETKKPETKKPERIVAEKKRSASIKKEIAPEKKKVVPARNRPNDSSASATKPVVSVSRLKPESVSASVPLEGLALAATNS